LAVEKEHGKEKTRSKGKSGREMGRDLHPETNEVCSSTVALGLACASLGTYLPGELFPDAQYYTPYTSGIRYFPECRKLSKCNLRKI